MSGSGAEQARSALLTDLVQWLGEAQRILASREEPPASMRMQLYADLADLQSRTRTLGMAVFEPALRQCGVLLQPSYPIAKANESGLGHHLQTLSELGRKAFGAPPLAGGSVSGVSGVSALQPPPALTGPSFVAGSAAPAPAPISARPPPALGATGLSSRPPPPPSWNKPSGPLAHGPQPPALLGASMAGAPAGAPPALMGTSLSGAATGGPPLLSTAGPQSRQASMAGAGTPGEVAATQLSVRSPPLVAGLPQSAVAKAISPGAAAVVPVTASPIGLGSHGRAAQGSSQPQAGPPVILAGRAFSGAQPFPSPLPAIPSGQAQPQLQGPQPFPSPLPAIPSGQAQPLLQGPQPFPSPLPAIPSGQAQPQLQGPQPFPSPLPAIPSGQAQLPPNLYRNPSLDSSLPPSILSPTQSPIVASNRPLSSSLPASIAMPGQPATPGQPPGGVPSQKRPNFAVRTMLGLRAFGRSAPSPREANPERLPASPQAAGRPVSVLGLRAISNAAPPPLVHNLQGLPPLDPNPAYQERGNRSQPPDRSADAAGVGALIGRMKTGASGQPPRGNKGHSARPAPAKRPKPNRAQTDFPWWAAALGLLVVGGGIVGLVLLMTHRGGTTGPLVGSSPDGGPMLAANTGSTRTAGPESPPRVPATDPSVRSTSGFSDPGLPGTTAGTPNADLTLEQCKTYFMQMRDRTGKESPELRMLLDDAFSGGKQLANPKCVIGGSHSCQSLQEVCRMLTAQGGIRQAPATGETDRWLAGLKKPDVPVANKSAVRHVFERYTVNPADHEAFQSMFFRCGSYQETIKTLLTRYDLPSGIMALVITESGCVPTIESPVGALGLWQLMPAAGRAYHLRVMDELDERRSPIKATEAGIRYLADVYQKLGDWELTFASYNMGMYGVLARVARAQRAGIARPTFWDLQENDLLPRETANYVPTIEAYALILENMRSLHFTEDQRPQIVTGDLEVLPGTRLGLIAHAAATTVNQIRALNQDILIDRIPLNLPGKFVAQVPRDNVFRARDALQQFATLHDDSDLCVPDTFDWGKERFTAEMAAECRRRLTGPAQ